MGRGLASRLNDVIAVLAPEAAARRERALAERTALMSLGHYEGAGRGPRGKDFRVNRTDAIEAGRHDRARLSWVSRDMLRNNPRVAKAQAMFVGQTVGAGILPRVRMADPEDVETKARIEALIERHCGSSAIDADGRLNLFGLQALAMSEIAGSGEVLVRRRMRMAGDGLPLPFQLQVLEGDFLDDLKDGPMAGGGRMVQGVEFDAIGRRVAYHLFAEHPGGRAGPLRQVRRILAENVIHAFDQKRPGQVRGMSWFAPVITLLHELQKYQDAQIKRQEIAALFAGILTTDKSRDELDLELQTLQAGALLTLGADEKMDWSVPPKVDDYEPFMRGTDRAIAAGLGLTYEGFAGDYSGVNFSSARMGRLDTDPNVARWQNHIMIAQVCDPVGGWLKEGIADVADIDPETYALTWTAPRRPMIDPAKEHAANAVAVDNRFKSRRQVIREGGQDPAEVDREIEEEERADAARGRAATPRPAAGATAQTEKDDTDD